MNHLLKTHKNIIPDCADLLSQAPGEISSDARSVLNDIARGKLDIQIDGLMIGILIRKMVVTPKQTLVIHFLDGTTYRHRLGATPRGTRLYNTQRDHSRMLALYSEGCSAKEISQRLGIRCGRFCGGISDSFYSGYRHLVMCHTSRLCGTI